MVLAWIGKPIPKQSRRMNIGVLGLQVIFLWISSLPAFSWEPPVLSRWDSLFITAATGEPRFQRLRDSTERILVADTGTSAYLLAHRLAGQTPRQRHYVERLLTVISDSGRNRTPVVLIAGVLTQAPDSVKSQLLRIGSELGDRSFLTVARSFLGADSEEVRKAAVRCLGMYPDSLDIPGLLERIKRSRALERQGNLWALSRQKNFQAWPELLFLLGDEYLYNRQLARRIIAKACHGDWALVAKHRPSSPDAAERIEWMLLAQEFSTSFPR